MTNPKKDPATQKETKSVIVTVAPLSGHPHFHFCSTSLQSSDKANVGAGADAWFRCDMFEPVEDQAADLLVKEGIAEKICKMEIFREGTDACFDFKVEFIPAPSKIDQHLSTVSNCSENLHGLSIHLERAGNTKLSKELADIARDLFEAEEGISFELSGEIADE